MKEAIKHELPKYADVHAHIPFLHYRRLRSMLLQRGTTFKAWLTAQVDKEIATGGLKSE